MFRANYFVVCPKMVAEVESRYSVAIDATFDSSDNSDTDDSDEEPPANGAVRARDVTAPTSPRDVGEDTAARPGDVIATGDSGVVSVADQSAADVVDETRAGANGRQVGHLFIYVTA